MLVPLTETEDGEQAVLGRDLWTFLEVKTPYMQWFSDMQKYGFTCGFDFTEISAKSLTSGNVGRPRKDHILTLDMAKELSMIQRTEKGKQWFPPPGAYALTSGNDYGGISPKLPLTCKLHGQS